jgi:hypothetical protein
MKTDRFGKKFVLPAQITGDILLIKLRPPQPETFSK